MNRHDASKRPKRIPDFCTVAELLQKTGSSIECLVRGCSMGNTLPDGCRFRLEFQDISKTRLGEVVAFRLGQNTIVHRLVGRGVFGPAKSFVVTRGDRSVLTDYPIPVQSIAGVVREWTDGDRWQSVGAYPPTGWRLLVARAILWQVILALHVWPRLAFWLTRATYSVGARFRRPIIPG